MEPITMELEMPRLPLINKVFIFSLAVMFLLAMHFPMQNPGGAGLSLSFNVTTWMALSISLGIGLYKISTAREIKYSALTISLFVCALLLTIPILYDNVNMDNISNRLIGLWVGFVFFVVLQQFKFSEQQKQQLLWLVVLAVIIEALFGLWQYLMLEPGNMFVYNTKVNRPYGIFQQPNVMASFLATGLVISGFLIPTQLTRSRSVFSKMTLLYLVPLLTVPLLIALASRTGWLGATLATIGILPFIYHFSTKKHCASWLISIIVGAVLGIIIIQSQGTGDFILAKADVESPRRYTIPQTLDMIVEKPLTGYGYGRFEHEYIHYTATRHQQDENYRAGLAQMDHPHNELLFWGAEGGVLPIIALLLAALFVALHINKVKGSKRLALYSLFIPIVLHTQLEYPFYHSAIHWFIFIILIYWIDQEVSHYNTQRFSNGSKIILRISSLLIPILTSVYMLTLLHTNLVLIEYERSNPKNPEILKQVSNHGAWKYRFEHDVYTTYFNIGLTLNKAELIREYVSWAVKTLDKKAYPSKYKRLILAYQALNEPKNVEKIKAEAKFLFPAVNFSNINYIPPSSAVLQVSEGVTLIENKDK